MGSFPGFCINGINHSSQVTVSPETFLCISYQSYITIKCRKMSNFVELEILKLYFNVDEGIEQDVELSNEFKEHGAGSILFTNVDVEGLLGGFYTDPVIELKNSVDLPIVYSGGVTTIDDVKKLNESGVEESTVEQVSFHCEGYGFGAIRDIELSVQFQKMEFDCCS